MPRIFIPAAALSGGRADITGDPAHHLAASLRLRSGDEFVVVDDGGIEHTIRADATTPAAVNGTVLISRPAEGESALHVEVIQALAKDGMDDAIDAMVQAGTAVIRPVITERTVTRPDDSRAGRRVERWRSVSREAAQLAFRARIPDVAAVTSLAEALEALPPKTRVFACVIGAAARPLASLDIDAGRPVAVCIGPEGGFGERDIKVLALFGAETVHLGPRVFRARLAGAIATTALMARSGGLDDVQPTGLDADASAGSRRG